MNYDVAWPNGTVDQNTIGKMNISYNLIGYDPTKAKISFLSTEKQENGKYHYMIFMIDDFYKKDTLLIWLCSQYTVNVTQSSIGCQILSTKDVGGTLHQVISSGLDSFGVVPVDKTNPNVTFYDFMDTSKVVHTLVYTDATDSCIHFQRRDHHLFCSKPDKGEVLTYNLNDFGDLPLPINTITLTGKPESLYMSSLNGEVLYVHYINSTVAPQEGQLLLYDMTDVDNGDVNLYSTISNTSVLNQTDFQIVGVSKGTVYLASVLAGAIEEIDVSDPSAPI